MIVICVPKISPGGTDPVHHHLCHISAGHFRPHDHMLRIIYGIIHPMLIMMLIAPFMMEPGGRHARILTFCVIWASVSLIIFAAHQKFRRGIFGKVMEKPLLVKSDSEAIVHNHQLMLCDCFKVKPWMHCRRTSFPYSQLLSQYCLKL